MASSIINSDDGVVSGTSGLKSTGGDDGVLVFQSKGTETARINTDKQIVAAAGTASLPIYSTTGDLNTGIFFPAADTIAFAEGGVEAMRIDSSGNLGLAVTPSAWGSTYKATQIGGDISYLTGGSNMYVTSNAYRDTNGDYRRVTSNHATMLQQTNGIFTFNTAASSSAGSTISFSETMRITSAGNVGIGGTPLGRLEVADVSQLTTAGAWASATIACKQVGGFIGDYSQMVFGYHAGTQTYGSAYMGFLETNQGTNGYGDLVFGTRAVNTDTQPTERMRITSTGAITTPDTASAAHQFGVSRVDGVIIGFRNAAASSPYGVSIQFTAASPDNNTNYFLQCSDSTANRTIIYSDGDVWTADAGTLSSDQKLKNTITDASPKLDDVMKLRVRNFYWNEDYHPEKTDKKLIGFIAQEFEEVFPGLVTEGVIRGGQPIYEDQAVVDEEGNPILDEEGNAKTEQVQVGETEKEYAKGIKEGKLIPILVKALQEAVERIETLEAKVAALENA